jgi:NADPH:quinone reductase-like Zn-dependent oxidoreductase
MKAARIHRFGPPEVIVIDDISCPTPKPDELIVRVAAAGVGPWDALIREHKSAVNISLPVILGSDFAGVVDSVGSEVTQFKPGDEIYGVTNKDFYGAYAEYAVAKAQMVAPKPKSLTLIEAASVPVIAVTVWQMLFDYAQVKAGQSVLIHGAAGNVGAYAVQLAKHGQLRVYATAGPNNNDLDYVRSLGADEVINYKTTQFEDVATPVDAVLDMVGGETQRRSFAVLKPGGILVSIVSPVLDKPPQPAGLRSAFFLVEVTTDRLNSISKLFESGTIACALGTVLPLAEARTAHQMLAGAPHKRGKIVLQMPDFA